jgi:hypothetical protein
MIRPPSLTEISRRIPGAVMRPTIDGVSRLVTSTTMMPPLPAT